MDVYLQEDRIRRVTTWRRHQQTRAFLHTSLTLSLFCILQLGIECVTPPLWSWMRVRGYEAFIVLLVWAHASKCSECYPMDQTDL